MGFENISPVKNTGFFSMKKGPLEKSTFYILQISCCESSETTDYISLKHNWRIFN